MASRIYADTYNDYLVVWQITSEYLSILLVATVYTELQRPTQVKVIRIDYQY